MRLFGTVLIAGSFPLSLCLSATVLWTGRVQVSKYGGPVAVRAENPVRYWIPTSLFLLSTIAGGFAVYVVVWPDKRRKPIHLDSIPFAGGNEHRAAV